MSALSPPLIYSISSDAYLAISEQAATVFQHPWALELSGQLRDCLQSNASWIGMRSPGADKTGAAAAPVKMIDYACGFGLVSRTLYDHADIIRGVDVSDTMVASYNDISRSSGIPPGGMRAVRGNLLDAEAEAPLAGADFHDADAAFVSMALHHVSDPQLLLARLAQRLAPGGVLVVMDWLVGDADTARAFRPHHHHHHEQDTADAHHTISRGGFSADEMRGLFDGAGCDPDTFDLRPNKEASHIPEEISKVEGGVHMTFFIAKARRP